MCGQFVLGFLADLCAFQYTLTGSFNLKFSFHFGTISDLLDAPFFGLKVVEVVGHHCVELIEQRSLFLAVESLIPHIRSHLTPVRLFHKTLVIFHALSGSGVGDLFLVTIAFQMPVHKLSTRIKVQPQYRERETHTCIMNGCGSKQL